MSARALVNLLEQTSSSQLNLIRKHTGRYNAETVEGFEVFNEFWRNIPKKHLSRDTVWLILKLYAYEPLPNREGQAYYLTTALGKVLSQSVLKRELFKRKFSNPLNTPHICPEEALRWALKTISINFPYLDWVNLTDELSHWHDPNFRQKWTERLLNLNQGTEK